MKPLSLAVLLLALALSAIATNASLSFNETVLDESMSDPWLKSVGDVDGDGQVDIIVGGSQKCGLVTYLNRYPDWQRSPVDTERGFSTDGECADIDGDGRNDLIAITKDKGGQVVWYHNTGSGWEFNTLSDTSIHDVETGDIDGDGLVDLAGRNQKEWPNGEDNGNCLYLFWQKRAPDGSIQWEESTIPCPPGEGLLLADLDQDGDADLVINGSWFENTGQRHWKHHAFASREDWDYPNSYVAIGDINGDGRDDLLLSPSELKDGSYKVSWFECPENPTTHWKEHTIAPKVETVLHFIGAADFNKDGQIDVVTAEMTQGADPDQVLVYLNRGSHTNGQWKDEWETVPVSESGSHSMRILDANSDGSPDLFGANWRANGQDEFVKLWINQAQP